ncbi:methyltransferase type 11 [Aureimonas fodinaquatilis]|uniref:Methyltransferase type 11 n=1 Tax=Aureimonas fodinaquatilis TaxID=2565783 RepID=A0A5B0E342_9HYPH|nr:small ribosomal subunit Rsm22 family protein [Aureimonas fodinaquatilis]KAA0972391.1 methyltransferase type 11 [Aureimonas fodinaquatilis]
MELPAALQAGINSVLQGVSLADLQNAAATLSRRYRAEVMDGRLHIGGEPAARAYLATRMPATYAAVRQSFEMAAEISPEFAPASMLDVGAGPGTVLWAAADCWPGLDRADMIEASPFIRQFGEQLAAPSTVMQRHWRTGRAEDELKKAEAADLVTLAYVLDELPPATQASLVDKLWLLTKGMLVLIEPGTPAGTRRILAARERLLALGAHLSGPCAHSHACPLVEPDWCHFAARVARSRMHRLAKGAEVPFEDEKFIFIAATRWHGNSLPARVLAPPRSGSGKVTLKLCQADGQVQNRMLTRRDGQSYKSASRADWGDAL